MKKKITEAVRKKLKIGDVIWSSLDPTLGSETQKDRPCIVLSAQQMNEASLTVTVVPLSSGQGSIMRLFPSLSPSQNDCNVHGAAVLSQIRSIDPVARNAYLIGTITDQAFIEDVQIRLAAILGITTGLLDGDA